MTKKRNRTFTVDAESVQGIEGAQVTFKILKRREYLAWRDDPDTTDDDLVKNHIVSWKNILDEDGNEMPSPQDQPEVLGELFFHEVPRICSLLLAGPDGDNALKN